VRILVAVPVLVAAIYGEYLLASIPLPIEVEKAVNAALTREELVIVGPFREVDQHPGELRAALLPADDTTKGISIAAHFDSARFSESIMTRLQRDSERDPKKEPPPPSGLQQIDYTTDEPEEDSQAPPRVAAVETAQPCSAAIALALADDSRPPKEIHFLQPTDPSFGDRALEIKAVGADLVVQLSVVDATQPAPPAPKGGGKRMGPGCSKTVSAGTHEYSFTGPTDLEIIVPAEQSFKVWFSPLPGQNPWPKASDTHEPFKLVTLPAVSASGLRKISLGGSPSITPSLNASSVAGEQPLLLRHLRIAAEELQLEVSGKAMVQENGKDIVTFDLWQWMKSNTLIALLLSGLEIGLINWVRLSFKRSRIPDDQGK